MCPVRMMGNADGDTVPDDVKRRNMQIFCGTEPSENGEPLGMCNREWVVGGKRGKRTK